MGMFLKIKHSNALILLICISIIGLIALQLHNVLTHPIVKGFDAGGHIEYINYIKQYHSIPTVVEGFELYQQPMYYLIAAFLPTFRIVKIMGFFFWIILFAASFLFFYKSTKNTISALVFSYITASVPVVLYMSVSISNEFLSTLLIILSIIYAVFYNKRSKKSNIVMGLLMGLAIATKATALVFVLAFVLSIFIQERFKIKRALKFLLIPLFVMFVVGSAVYIRNAIVFKNPVVDQTGFPLIFPMNQKVAARNIEFFLSPLSLLKLDLFRAQHYSFIAGTLFSFFYDGHNVIVPVQAFSKAGIVLVSLSAPLLLLSIIGFFKNIKAFLFKKENILFIYPILLIVAYIAYNIKFPFYSAVKASYVSSIALSYSFFIYLAVKKHKHYIGPLSLFIFIYNIVLIKVFFYLPFWR